MAMFAKQQHWHINSLFGEGGGRKKKGVEGVECVERVCVRDSKGGRKERRGGREGWR